MSGTDFTGQVFVSLVCHRQGPLIPPLLEDLARCPEVGQLVITHNVPEAAVPVPDALTGRTLVLTNPSAKGFGANHNAAFQGCRAPFFCVLNPDIRLIENPFPALLACLADSKVAVAAPAVLNPLGDIEDSARHFPTPIGLVRKALGRGDGRYAFRLGDAPLKPEWIAGMFLLLRSTTFSDISGFDEGFFLYYEDVDLCARLHADGWTVLLCPHTSVVHDPRRASHRNLRHFAWHMRSITRFFRKHLGRLPGRHGG